MRPGPADLRRPADHPLTSRAGVTSTPAPTERTTTVTRPRTPDVQNPNGSTTITMKRACNGCHQTLGDVTTKEMLAGMNGLPLPDVRPECPNCQAEYPVPECRPMTLSVGLTECGERECEEYLHEDGEDNGLDLLPPARRAVLRRALDAVRDGRGRARRGRGRAVALPARPEPCCSCRGAEQCLSP